MSRFREPCQLHNHSMYSLLDAVPSATEWVAWCLENDTPGFSITDHGTAISLYYATKFPQLIEQYNKEHGTNHSTDKVVGVPGVELYVKLDAKDRGHYHINAWAVNNQGYHNLMKLASLAYNDTVTYFGVKKGRVTFDQLQEYREGIKFGTACIASPMGKCIMKGAYSDAEDVYKAYIEMFGDDLYVEFHPTDLTHDFNKKTGGFDPIGPGLLAADGNYQKAYNKFLAEMIDKYGGKPIPATDAHFIKPEDKVIQDCLLKNGNDNGWYFYESYHQHKADEIYDMLKSHLGDWLTEEKFNQWIDNTYEIMNAAKNIDIQFDYHLPKIDIPEDIKIKTDDYDTQTYYLLMKKIQEHGRWRNDQKYIDRFKKEIDVIMKNETLNFIPYFLMYEDISKFVRSQGILQNLGRGSAGGSLVSYYLKIIHVDPIKAHLPFERFLSHARIRAGSFPDIDLDIGDRARPLVMQYLQDTYGLGFAQIATFNKMKTKNAIKDAMYAIYGYNRNHPEVKGVCDTIPDSPQGTDESDFLYGYTDNEGNYNEGEVERNKHLANFFQNHLEVESMVKRLLGMPRGWSRHASAFVISTLDLSASRVPTMTMNDKSLGMITVTQYDASLVEKCGLVKADILGLKTLTALSDCVQLVKERSGVDFLEEDDNGIAKIYRLEEDTGVYRDFYNKKTDSSFQFNTSLIKGYIQRFNPSQRQHLYALTALCRPGALDAPFMNDEISIDDGISAAQYYMDVRNGARKLSYLHPDLANYTTNGVFVYQEEVMKFIVEIGGYSWEEADQIRGAIAKKKESVIIETFDQIRKSTIARGWTLAQADAVCNQILAFSKYSFNRSHSHAYGELGYITMYLKHYYRTEWWCAVLNSEKSEDKIRHHITLLGDLIQPPSLKRPLKHFAVENGKIIAPIGVMKGIGPKVIDHLMETGPYENLPDFMSKISHTKVNIGAISALIKGRACDAFMNMSLPYPEARANFMEEYLSLKSSRTSKFNESLYDFNPLSIFLQERDTNKSFNKYLLGDKNILDIINEKWPNLRRTDKDAVPFVIGHVPVLCNIKVAAGVLEHGHGDDVGMILLYEGSAIRSGISKKSGRPWSLLSVKLSDGYQTIEAASWDLNKALKWPKDSLVYIRGTLKEGWKTPVSITISEIEKIGDSE